MKHAGWPQSLQTKEQVYSLRITKTAKLWLLEQGYDEICELINAAPPRADEAAQVTMTAEQLREMWYAMDRMLDEMYERKYTPGVNSAVGMQRKAESFLPGLPW